MGTIYKRGGKWWIGYLGVDGRRYLETSRSHLRDDAKKLLQLREGAIAKNEPVTPAMARLTFEDAARDVVNDYTTNGKRSLGHVQRRLEKHLIPFFGGRRLVTITTADVREYVAHRQADTVIVQRARTITTPEGTRQLPEKRRTVAHISNAEINRELAILKRAFTLSMQAGKLTHRPYIPMLAEDNVRCGFFDAPQLLAILAHLPEPVQQVVKLAAVTGWRVPSEVLTLEWRHVDLEAATVTLDAGTTKNREARTFVMTSALKQLLQTQRDRTTKLERDTRKIIRWVFHRDGKRIRDFRASWRSACVAAGQPGRIPHDFRRTAVRNLVRAGVPERVAMQMTGHKTRSVFERYNIVSESDLKEAARKLEAASIGTATAKPKKARGR